MGRPAFERIRASAAAAILGLEVRTVQALAARGSIPGAAKLGGTWTFDETALHKFSHTIKNQKEKNRHAAPKKRDEVYVIQCGSCIKIGYTTNLHQRLHSLKTANPSEIELIGSFPGTRRDEQALHLKFSHLRAKGEWFHADWELRSWILKTFGVRISKRFLR